MLTASSEKENKYMAQDGNNCLEQAKQLLESNGSLTEVALLLEAAIQKGQLGEGDYEAWILLGDTRCMDEREEAGMRALTEGARRAEASGAKGVGLLVSLSPFLDLHHKVLITAIRSLSLRRSQMKAMSEVRTPCFCAGCQLAFPNTPCHPTTWQRPCGSRTGLRATE